MIKQMNNWKLTWWWSRSRSKEGSHPLRYSNWKANFRLKDRNYLKIRRKSSLLKVMMVSWRCKDGIRTIFRSFRVCWGTVASGPIIRSTRVFWQIKLSSLENLVLCCQCQSNRWSSTRAYKFKFKINKIRILLLILLLIHQSTAKAKYHTWQSINLSKNHNRPWRTVLKEKGTVAQVITHS